MAGRRLLQTVKGNRVAKAAKQTKTIDFEAEMAELEALVEAMEQGELTLEESIKQFERGIQLAKNCQSALKVAEQKVQKLAGDGDDARLEPFTDDADD